MRPFERVRSLTIIVVTLLFAGCREQVVHDLSEARANMILSRLTGAGMSGEKVRDAAGKWAISVPEYASASTIQFLERARLLTSRTGAGAPDRAGLLMSRHEQRMVHERRLSSEIETTLASLPGILDARVHLNLPFDEPFGPKQQRKSSASVLLVADAITNRPVDHIAALVAGASGINPRDVEVLIEPAGLAPDFEPVPQLERDRLLWWVVLLLVLAGTTCGCLMGRRIARGQGC